MRHAGGLASLAALATAIRLLSPGIARAEGREPSIEEMWAEVEARLAAKTATPAAASGEERAEAAKGARRAGRRRQIDFRPLLKRLNARAQELLEVYRRDGYELEAATTHMRLEAFDEAARILERVLKRRSTVSRHGLVEAEYACAMAQLGQQDVAYRYIPLSEKVLEQALLVDDEESRPGRGTVQVLRQKLDFVRNFPEARQRLAELTASLARAPDPDMQWELVGLYDAEQGAVRLGVKWLIGVHTMRVLYPDHEVNRDGSSDRMLARAYRYHCMYEECIDHLTQVLESGPKTLPYVRDGYAHWDRAYSQELLAGLHRRMGQREQALAGFEKALGYFQEFQRDLPECSFTRRSEKREASYVEVRIRRIREAIEELGGRPQREPRPLR